MNAPVHRGKADLRREATLLRLHDLPEGGPSWLRAAREAARARLLDMGLPQRRDEYWRFTDPATLAGPDVPDVDPGDAAGAFADVPALRLAFVDGAFAGSEGSAPLGVEVARLGEAGEDHWAASLLGTIEAEGHAPVPRTLAALNTATARDGVLLRATGTAEGPVHLVQRQGARASDAVLHHLVRVEAGASLTLIESGAGGARLNAVLEIDLAEGAVLHHVRLQDGPGLAATHVFARLAAGAQLRSFTLTLGGPLTRNEAVVRLSGDDALAHLAGAAVGDGAFHHDDTVFLVHEGQRCESRQVFKKVLREGGTGVFQGKILVRKGAQKTDGYQLAQGLLLDETGQFLAKPELEIYADDVVCSHGATAGALDEGALFYLRSRGVPRAEAANLLTLAFLQGALAEIADPRLRAELGDRLEAWMAARA